MTYSQLGGTHHAMEDVAVACAMPNMRVLAPCDPSEVSAATQWCIGNQDGPVYLRLGKAGEKDISKNATEPWRYGKVRYLRGGREACVIGYGPILGMAMEATEGQDIAVVSVSTLKPLDTDGLGTILRRYPLVVVLEEAVSRGGLGQTVKSLAYDLGAKCSIQHLALKNYFIHKYGTHDELLEAHGLTAEALMEKLNG